MISTIYTFENTISAHVYEIVGFVITDIINEENNHELNMLLSV